MHSTDAPDPFGANENAKVAAIEDACRALAAGTPEVAAGVIRTRYPFEAVAKPARRYSAVEMTRVFVRDGFIDRYTGARLVFPGVLRLLSILMPGDLPFHPNWKVAACHPAYWELFPTIDHAIPVARGGLDEESNWVTTSMRSNAAKASWTIAELGWSLHPEGRMEDWDGLAGWFVEYGTAHRDVLAKNDYLRRWWRAATTTAALAATRAVPPGKPARRNVVEPIGRPLAPGEDAIDLTDDGGTHWGPGEGPRTHPSAADIEDELGLPALDRELSVPPGRAEWMPPPGFKPKSK